ncbi:MAG: hypothetical protein LUG16_05770, partial [Candidatus Gastranaerophilales bacterium]|nr:hypothetical protein [Candidatus Gastranaerophilales bacterium]
IMIIKHQLIFLKEYFSVYNFLRYTGLKNISVVIGLFMLGFSPWIFSFLWILGTRARSILDSIINYFLNNSQDKLKEKWNKLKKIEKFLSVNIIVFFFSFIYALLYGAKYTFTILFLMFPAACIAGHYWYEYLIKKKHAKSIFFATIIPDIILIICSLVGLFGHNILNKWLFQGELKHLLIPLIVIFFVIPVIGIFAVILKGKRAAFISNIILMLTLSFVITPGIFNFISKTGGENDLIQFAQIANKDKVKLAAYIPSQKYSLIYYYDSKVIFNKNDNIKWLADFLKENPNAYVVTEIKELWNIEENNVKYMLLDAGTRYAMIQDMPYDMRQEETEPEIIVY